jgi:hypothetical protein
MPNPPNFSITLDGRDAKQTRLYLKAMRMNQLPFAIASAQTKTAVAARKAIQKDAFKRFKLKNKRFPRIAIHVKEAAKHDFPKSVAMIFVEKKHKYLALQERGGTKRSGSGHRLAIPTRLVRKTKGGKVMANNTVTKIRNRKETRVNEEAQTVSSRKKSGQGGIWYLLRRRAKIKPVFKFEDTGTAEIKRAYPGIFTKQLRKAIATARKGGGGRGSAESAAARRATRGRRNN